MGRRDRVRWKNWRARGAVAIAAAAITATVVTTAWPIDGPAAASRPNPAGSAAGRSGSVRLAGSFSDIPAGWDPVPYRRAELFVPGQWPVEPSLDFFCQPHAAGMIFAGAKPVIPKGTGCSLPAR